MYFSAEEAYKNISEEYVANILRDITEEHFFSVFDGLKKLLQKQVTIPENQVCKC